jgi:hypothetical protein
MLHFKPFPPFLDDSVILGDFLYIFSVVWVSPPWGDSPIDIHLSQEKRMAKTRISRLEPDSLRANIFVARRR